MKLEKGKFCPLLQQDCIELKCAWFTQIRGTNPNTGEPVDEWDCSINWLPFLVIESTQQNRQTGAAVESFRNEVVKANESNKQLYLQQQTQINPLMLPIQTNRDS